MSWLADMVLGPFFEWVKWFGRSAWDLWKKWELFRWKAFLAVAGVIWVVLSNAAKWIAQTVAMLDAMMFPSKDLSAPGTASWILDLCNTIFPLSEAVGFLLAYYGFVIAFGVYRFVKSWIPTVSGNA